MEQLDYNLLFRWFVGLRMDDAVWSPTTFTKNRDRLLSGDIAAAFFDAVLIHAECERLLSDDHFTVDGHAARSVGQPEEFSAARSGSARSAFRRPAAPHYPTRQYETAVREPRVLLASLTHGHQHASDHRPVSYPARWRRILLERPPLGVILPRSSYFAERFFLAAAFLRAAVTALFGTLTMVLSAFRKRSKASGPSCMSA